jgi:hypothetical protein
VGGKPGQHLQDRLGLLLLQAAAFLPVHQLHLEGDPDGPGRAGPLLLRPRSRVGSAAGGRGGRLDRVSGLGFGLGMGRFLFASPAPSAVRWAGGFRRAWGSAAAAGLAWSALPARVRVSIMLKWAFARLRVRRHPGRSGTDEGWGWELRREARRRAWSREQRGRA